MTYHPHTKATFQALVDAFIPSTPVFAMKKGLEQAAGAINLQVYQYIIWELDHFMAVQKGMNLAHLPLSHVTAYLLDAAADQLIATGKVKGFTKFSSFPGGGSFTILFPEDRIQTIEIIDQINLDLGKWPPPYQNNPGLIKQVVAALPGMTMFGFYSEWPGYGSTRLFEPEYRTLENFPHAWIQVGYPGPAYGYRDFRGYL